MVSLCSYLCSDEPVYSAFGVLPDGETRNARKLMISRASVYTGRCKGELWHSANVRPCRDTANSGIVERHFLAAVKGNQPGRNRHHTPRSGSFVYYYLRVVATLYMRPAETEKVANRATLPEMTALCATSAVILLLGPIPGHY